MSDGSCCFDWNDGEYLSVGWHGHTRMAEAKYLVQFGDNICDYFYWTLAYCSLLSRPALSQNLLINCCAPEQDEVDGDCGVYQLR